MKKETREALTAYYNEAGSWAEDGQARLRSSRKLAWVVAGVAVVVALCEAFALVALAPLKTVVPYTLLVDRQTGYVQALDPLERQRITPDNALTQSFLVQYVLAREGFDYATVQANYRKVTLWSAGDARSRYIGTMQVSNPASPLVRLPRATLLEARVKSVSPLGRDAALVRFDTVRSDAGGPLRLAGSWVAVIRYRYGTEPLAVEDRYLNPLGFQVTRYRVDPEVVPPAVEQAQATAPSSVVTR